MSKSVKSYQSNWLVSTIKAGLFACLFMPLLIGGSFIFPYIFPKQASFQIIVEIILALYLFLALKNPDYRPRSSWLFKALTAYFVVMILSSIFGVNTYHSFWSNYERMAGVISLLHYLGFLFVAANIFKTQKDWHKFFDFSILASVIEAFYGLGQLAGIFTSSGGARLDGTIGNASFLAGYMLFNALFALWLMLEKRSTGWRLFYGLAIVVNLFVMYETQTRGALVAFGAGVLGLFIFFIFARQKDLAILPFARPERLKRYLLAVFIGLFLVGGFIFLSRDSAFVQNSPTLSRITHINLAETTAQTRLMAWQMSWRGFLGKPLFGWGPENYYVVFNQFYNPDLYPVESWFDRSHNAYLDILVNTGLLGMAAYLAVIFLAFWYLWSAWRQGKITYFTAAIFSVVLLTYGIQNVFVFDTQVTLLMFYSIMAFIVFLSVKPSAENLNIQPVRPNFFFKVTTVLILAFALYFVNIKPGLASMEGIGALQTLQQGKADESLAQFKASFDIGTYGLPEIAMRVQDAALQLSQNSNIPADVKKKFTKLAIDGMNGALGQEPLNVRFMMMLTSVYLSSAASDNDYLAQADALLQKALELSPTRQELYFYTGQIKMYQGRPADALAQFKRAVELNDRVSLSHWNYGVIAIGVGQKDLGEAEIKKAKELGRAYGLTEIKQLISAYKRTSDWPRIIALHQEWIKLASGDAAPYASLAAVYAQMGDKQKAKELALQAIQINPSYQSQSEQFIKGLGL
ncbi:MAG: O-antigen ligase family protein [Candidatus Portnoybacteria bacterium]|nr:O-antigen ligase family protein [Candidatus Portnoybacteria bacterium]MDD4982511.1 O-antigen ligase family protein [Candidatus Portnoybacteria bacterium]